MPAVARIEVAVKPSAGLRLSAASVFGLFGVMALPGEEQRGVALVALQLVEGVAGRAHRLLQMQHAQIEDSEQPMRRVVGVRVLSRSAV